MRRKKGAYGLFVRLLFLLLLVYYRMDGMMPEPLGDDQMGATKAVASKITADNSTVEATATVNATDTTTAPSTVPEISDDNSPDVTHSTAAHFAATEISADTLTFVATKNVETGAAPTTATEIPADDSPFAPTTTTETNAAPTAVPERSTENWTLAATAITEMNRKSEGIKSSITLTSCCVHPVSVEDLVTERPLDFFMKRSSSFVDKNNLYENWLAVVPKRISGNRCIDQWMRLTIKESMRNANYLGNILQEIDTNASFTVFPFLTPPSNKTIPRALFLGDSVSVTTWLSLMSRYRNRGVYLAGAPTNCGGFGKYNNRLSHWLGPCTWDFVQFNVGLHFHPQPEGDWRTEYQQEILAVVQNIHAHSPSAKIVIALTTPSPLDTNATYPSDNGSCPHLNKFHKTGFISGMNDVIVSIFQGNETIPGLWGINDRYSLMAPHLIDYQLPCDVHYRLSGYQRLADKDWEIVASALQISRSAAVNQ